MRKLNCLAFISILLLINPSYASTIKKETAKCAVIKGDLARLNCFDKLAMDNNLTGNKSTSAKIAGKGKWQVSTKINPIDDSKTVILFLEADSGKGKYGDKVFLVTRCQSNKTEFYINWKSYLGSEVYVLTRIGDNKASTSKWDISSDSNASFRNRPIPFLKEMMKENKFIAQVTPYNENPITAIFNIAGLENAIKPLRETCNW